MHIILKNKQPEKYSISQLRKDNRGTSFPVQMSDQRLAEWNVYPVTAVSKPTVDYTKNITEGIPSFNNDSWIQTWLISNATEEEIVQRTVVRASDMRMERNERLAACDWTQLPDTPVNDLAWATYRQILRDVTSQIDFPWSIVWPEPPQS